MLDVAASDVEALHRWWDSVVRQAPPGPMALWFGLVELADSDLSGWHMYVAGCAQFDSLDESADWACDPSWWPAGRYVSPAGLRHRASDSWDDMLAYAASLVIDLAPQSTWPGTVLGVAVGFDDGDFTVTWSAPPPDMPSSIT